MKGEGKELLKQEQELRGQAVEITGTEDFAPREHLLRKTDAAADFTRLYGNTALSIDAHLSKEHEMKNVDKLAGIFEKVAKKLPDNENRKQETPENA